VLFELKNSKFKPEYAGKMNFYLAALDATMRQLDDQPSIGMILCRKNCHITVEYALKYTSSPMGVAEYRLTNKLPDKLQDALPTAEDLTEGLKQQKRLSRD